MIFLVAVGFTAYNTLTKDLKNPMGEINGKINFFRKSGWQKYTRFEFKKVLLTGHLSDLV